MAGGSYATQLTRGAREASEGATAAVRELPTPPEGSGTGSLGRAAGSVVADLACRAAAEGTGTSIGYHATPTRAVDSLWGAAAPVNARAAGAVVVRLAKAVRE